MSEVWVVEGGVAYEGFEVVSVHASKEAAERAAVAVLAAHDCYFDIVEVNSYEVGQ